MNNTTQMCVCGHHRNNHDYNDGCIQFLCCHRRRNLTPGRRYTEHDGVSHNASYCPCSKYTEGENHD